MLGAVILVVVVALLAVTFLPGVVRRFRSRETRDPVSEDFEQADMTAHMLYSREIGQAPDTAEDSPGDVTLYVGGASSKNVTLEKKEVSFVLSVLSVSGDTVRFGGDGGYDAVMSGATAHKDFALEPSTSGGHGEFKFAGPGALGFLRARQDILNRTSAGLTLRLQNHANTIRSHDISTAALPVVPEICKYAAIQGVSMTFSTPKTGSGGASVFVMPRRESVPPVALHLRFRANDLVVTYQLLDGADASSPNAVVDLAAAREGSVLVLSQARSGSTDVAVVAQFSRGRVRVCTAEGSRRRSYFVHMPMMLRDAGSLASDALRPPAVMTRTYEAEDVAILPFAVGDLGVLSERRGK
jgi:hypothetical protein